MNKENPEKLNHLRKTENIKSIVVIGKRWNDTYGNTYHTSQLVINGETIFKSRVVYGYGNHYVQTVTEWMKAHDLIDKDCNILWQFARDHDINLVTSVADVARRKDL